MKYTSVPVLVVAGLLPAVVAAQPDSETAELRAEIEALRDRLDEIDASSSGTDRLAFSGDLRYRHETINDDAAATERNRHRIRARFGMTADLGDDLTVGMTLATGASNPVSANQSLDGGFTRKDIGFDRAFFAWDINEELELRGGKMANPLFRPGSHHLIFDGDLNPEGLALGYDGSNVFANIAGLWVEERSGGDDAILYALQGGYRRMLGDGAELTVGASYLDYSDTQGFLPFWLGLPQGNTVDASGNLVNDYDLAEVFAQVETEAAGRPLRLFIDYVQNLEADSFDTGFALGMRWGNASNPGEWDVS